MNAKPLDMFNLADKVAVISGGGGELCGAMALALGAIGVKVAVPDKDLGKVQRREEAIAESGGSAMKYRWAEMI